MLAVFDSRRAYNGCLSLFKDKVHSDGVEVRNFITSSTSIVHQEESLFKSKEEKKEDEQHQHQQKKDPLPLLNVDNRDETKFVVYIPFTSISQFQSKNHSKIQLVEDVGDFDEIQRMFPHIPTGTLIEVWNYYRSFVGCVDMLKSFDSSVQIFGIDSTTLDDSYFDVSNIVNWPPLPSLHLHQNMNKMKLSDDSISNYSGGSEICGSEFDVISISDEISDVSSSWEQFSNISSEEDWEKLSISSSIVVKDTTKIEEELEDNFDIISLDSSTSFHSSSLNQIINSDSQSTKSNHQTNKFHDKDDGTTPSSSDRSYKEVVLEGVEYDEFGDPITFSQEDMMDEENLREMRKQRKDERDRRVVVLDSSKRRRTTLKNRRKNPFQSRRQMINLSSRNPHPCFHNSSSVHSSYRPSKRVTCKKRFVRAQNTNPLTNKKFTRRDEMGRCGSEFEDPISYSHNSSDPYYDILGDYYDRKWEVA